MHKNIKTHNDKILFQAIFKYMYLDCITNVSCKLMNSLLDEFQIDIRNYRKIKREFSRDYLFDFGKSNEGLLGNAALGFLFYEIVSDIFDQKDFKERIDKILLEENPELKNIDKQEFFSNISERELCSTEAYFIMHCLCNSEFPINLELDFYEDEDMGIRLVDELGLEDIEYIDEHPIYKKYEKRQIETLLAALDIDSKADPILLYRSIASWTDEALNFSKNSRDIVAYRFGYHFSYDNIDSFHNNLDAIESIVKEEIKRYLIDELEQAEYEDNPLGISQIIRLASIKDTDTFFKEVNISCEEYFYLKEIAYTQRQRAYEFVFRKKDVQETLVNPSNSEELQAMQAVNDELNKKNQELLTQIEKLQAENESLKGKLSNKQKDFDGELRSLREEYDKKIKNQTLLNNETVRQNIGWALMLKIVTAKEHEDDLLFPYKLERIQKKRIFILGGRDEVKRELAKLVPQAVFIRDEKQQIPTGKCDCIFIFHEYFNHKTFYKYIKFARKNDIPVGYTPSTNMERVLSDLDSAIIRLEELEIPEIFIQD